MSECVTWILTADDWNAQVHVSRGGSSSLLHAVRNRIPERMVRRARATDFDELCSTIAPARPRDTHLCFAHELLSFLSDGAEIGAYDGLIVMATPAMMDALKSIAAPRIRDRIIAEIVMATPIGNPAPEGTAMQVTA